MKTGRVVALPVEYRCEQQQFTRARLGSAMPERFRNIFTAA